MHPEFRFQPGRRDLLQLAAAATGIAAFGGVNLLAGAQQGASAGHSRRRLRAAFSNIGLQVSWCAQGKEAAEYLGPAVQRRRQLVRPRAVGHETAGVGRRDRI